MTTNTREWLYRTFCKAAYYAVLRMPNDGPALYPIWFELLPYAGEWAYREDWRQAKGGAK